jgi:methionyl-tRNA synthetase
MALDLPLPRNVLVHGHWTMNREKMSKSTGNVVNPFFAIDRFDLDTMRFFLTLQGPLGNDSDYDNDYITRDYKKYLQNGIGNLTHRILGVTKWELRPCIEAAAAGKLTEPTAEDLQLEELLRGASAKVQEHMDNLDPKKALDGIMQIVQQVRPSLACWSADRTN